jgi:flagellar biosynthesis GTPase FlhF
MKIIITEQQSNEILTSMLEEMFDGYETKFEGDLRNIYVNGKLMAQLGPSSGIVSLDAFNELKDNLFFNSDKDLKEEVGNWVRNKFKSKNNIGKYGVSFKKLHGEERDLPKKPKKPHHATRQDKLEPGFNLDAFKERTSNIETKLKNKEDLIRAARRKKNPDSFENWWKKDTEKHNERERKEKEKQLSDISKMVARLKTDNK